MGYNHKVLPAKLSPIKEVFYDYSVALGHNTLKTHMSYSIPVYNIIILFYMFLNVCVACPPCLSYVFIKLVLCLQSFKTIIFLCPERQQEWRLHAVSLIRLDFMLFICSNCGRRQSVQ